MKLLECVSGEDNVARIIMFFFSFFILELLLFDCFLMLVLCNFHSCTPHNNDSVTKSVRNSYKYLCNLAGFGLSRCNTVPNPLRNKLRVATNA